VARRAHHKLAFRFFEPFRVLARVGKVAYRVQLPASAAIHPVFHVSQLKASLGDQIDSSVLPNTLTEFQIPAELLQRRWTAGDHLVQEKKIMKRKRTRI
jgi:hypothetical protein